MPGGGDGEKDGKGRSHRSPKTHRKGEDGHIQAHTHLETQDSELGARLYLEQWASPRSETLCVYFTES